MRLLRLFPLLVLLFFVSEALFARGPFFGRRPRNEGTSRTENAAESSPREEAEAAANAAETSEGFNAAASGTHVPGQGTAELSGTTGKAEAAENPRRLTETEAAAGNPAPDFPAAEKLLPESVTEAAFEAAPFTGTPLLGKGSGRADTLAAFLLSANQSADQEYVLTLAAYYLEEAETDGINHDVAFAQMCLETGFLRFGGLVTPEMNNFCGLGSLGEGIPGESFPEPRIGVRAHIQHLKAYASAEPLKGELVDPRYRWVRKGSAPSTGGLSGTWAADTRYAEKIETILERLLAFREQPADPPAPAEAVPNRENAPQAELPSREGAPTRELFRRLQLPEAARKNAAELPVQEAAPARLRQ
jgi:flagellum-specific peptidoglycan hydrolase FlgJ